MSYTQRRTIFDTPVITPVLRVISGFFWRLSGWRVTGSPEPVDKAIFICVPHTSNWDLAVVVAVGLQLRKRFAWMGKKSLFPWPVGWLARWLGGLAIDRSKASNTVEQMREAFEANERMMLVIAPEGTRSQVDEWKMGFYHIAVAAGVPIQLAALHAPDREVFLGPLFYPTGDIERDLPEIKRFFAGKVGIRSSNTSS